MTDHRMNEYYEHIVNGTNVNSICVICGAAVLDWHKKNHTEGNARKTDDGWMYPNQIKHLAWHRLINRRLAQAESTAAMFRPLGG